MKDPGCYICHLLIETALEEVSAISGWKEVDGPDSGCGLDYWFVATDEDGCEHEAYVNFDQGDICISLDEENVYEGETPDRWMRCDPIGGEK